MRIDSKKSFDNSYLIDLKSDNWLQKQRAAGKITAETLKLLQNLVVEKTTKSLIELNIIGEEYIIQAGGKPTFKGYKGFPAGVCISVNQQLVHGIPTDSTLKDGDLVSFDLGVTFEGAIADSAITCIYGEAVNPNHSKLVEVTNECLIKGIEAIKVGSRVGVIGNAIAKHANKFGFGIITKYGGHGLTWDNPHSAPFIANKATVEEGVRIQPGLSIAIEPLLSVGSPETRTLQDGWTVVTGDISCHAEHSIFVHEDHVEVLTWREDLEKSKFYFK